ncbi:glutamic acid-rich protein-like, partial [Cynara cardunculus var. scolymus]|uniref:glutamic acid-rich protein-like n=1 Tax=Cynara cardunculus var. scolymus TaxID=59895 RepID=UPI000D628E11
MDEVHKGMPLKDELSTDLSTIKIEVKEVKDQLSSVQTEAEAPRATANEVVVVNENPTAHEAPEAEIVDETVRAGAEAHDEDLPITSVADASDKEDDDEDDDDDSPNLPDAGKDLGEDDDDDKFTIQYQKHSSAMKGVSL